MLADGRFSLTCPVGKKLAPRPTRSHRLAVAVEDTRNRPTVADLHIYHGAAISELDIDEGPTYVCDKVKTGWYSFIGTTRHTGSRSPRDAR